MKYPELKQRMTEIIKPANPKEAKRLAEFSRKKIQGIGIYLKNIDSDKGVIEAWNIYNQKQADWEKYCRKERYEGKKVNWNEIFNYTPSGFNNEADDF